MQDFALIRRTLPQKRRELFVITPMTRHYHVEKGMMRPAFFDVPIFVVFRFVEDRGDAFVAPEYVVHRLIKMRIDASAVIHFNQSSDFGIIEHLDAPRARVTVSA